MRPAEPRPIRDGDPTDDFDCGNAVLNEWLTTRALRNEKSGDSRTYVSLDTDSGHIAGYYCLSASSIARKDAGGWLARNAPEPVPVILLGRLAVSHAAKGTGLGRDLLADAVAKAVSGASVMGARALIAEAIDEQAERFYDHLGLWRSAERPDLFAMRLQ